MQTTSADQNKAVHIGWNRRAGGIFFLKINKRACTSIRYTRVRGQEMGVGVSRKSTGIM